MEPQVFQTKRIVKEKKKPSAGICNLKREKKETGKRKARLLKDLKRDAKKPVLAADEEAGKPGGADLKRDGAGKENERLTPYK